MLSTSYLRILIKKLRGIRVYQYIVTYLYKKNVTLRSRLINLYFLILIKTIANIKLDPC